MDDETLKRLLRESAKICEEGLIDIKLQAAAFPFVLSLLIGRWQNERIDAEVRKQALATGIAGHSSRIPLDA